jgi:hypothetical protein
LVGAVPVFPTIIVKVKLSFTLACVGETDFVIDAFGVNVPVKVGEGVIVGDGPIVLVEVSVGTVSVMVAVGLSVAVSVGPNWAFTNTIGIYGSNPNCSII